MKKKISVSIALIIIFILFFSGCKYQPVFAAIEQEVKLKKASVPGLVQSLVKVGNTLYVCNGTILKKQFGSTGEWQKCATPGRAQGIATDGTDVYVVFNTGVHVLQGSTWQPIPGSEKILYVSGTKTVYGADSNTSPTIYTITKTGITSTGIKTDTTLKNASGEYAITEKKVFKAGAPVSLFAGDDSSILDCVSGEGGIFVLTAKSIHHYDGSAWSSTKHDISQPLGLAYLKEKKLLLVATVLGYQEKKLDDTTPHDLTKMTVIDIGSAQSSLETAHVSQYKASVGKWTASKIYAFSDSGKYTLYISTADPRATYTGLWGFYVPAQTEWNRE